jgi:hypothetical protein
LPLTVLWKRGFSRASADGGIGDRPSKANHLRDLLFLCGVLAHIATYKSYIMLFVCLTNYNHLSVVSIAHLAILLKKVDKNWRVDWGVFPLTPSVIACA